MLKAGSFIIAELENVHITISKDRGSRLHPDPCTMLHGMEIRFFKDRRGREAGCGDRTLADV